VEGDDQDAAILHWIKAPLWKPVFGNRVTPAPRRHPPRPLPARPHRVVGDRGSNV